MTHINQTFKQRALILCAAVVVVFVAVRFEKWRDELAAYRIIHQMIRGADSPDAFSHGSCRRVAFDKTGDSLSMSVFEVTSGVREGSVFLVLDGTAIELFHSFGGRGLLDVATIIPNATMSPQYILAYHGGSGISGNTLGVLRFRNNTIEYWKCPLETNGGINLVSSDDSAKFQVMLTVPDSWNGSDYDGPIAGEVYFGDDGSPQLSQLPAAKGFVKAFSQSVGVPKISETIK